MKRISCWVKKMLCHPKDQGWHFSETTVTRSFAKGYTEAKKAIIQDVNEDIVLSCHEPHWKKQSNRQIVKWRTRRWWDMLNKSVMPDGRPVICQEDNMWVTLYQKPVTPMKQLFLVSMKTQSCLARSHTENKESNHQIVKWRTRRWWDMLKKSVMPDGRPMICQEDNPVTKLKGDIVPSHSGSRGKTVISQEGHGYENNFVSRDTVENKVVSTWHCITRWHFPRSHSNAKWATKSLTKKRVTEM